MNRQERCVFGQDRIYSCLGCSLFPITHNNHGYVTNCKKGTISQIAINLHLSQSDVWDWITYVLLQLIQLFAIPSAFPYCMASYCLGQRIPMHCEY